MNNGILSLGGPKATPAFLPLEVLHVYSQTNLISAWNDTDLVYTQVVNDLYGGYSTIDGTYTVPAGKGGLYAAAVTYIAGQGTAGTDSADLKVIGSIVGIVSLSNGGLYCVVDGYYRFSGTVLIPLQDGEVVNVAVFSTAEVSPNNDFPSFNSFRLFKIS